jgi:CheY-like chemotaxis protein
MMTQAQAEEAPRARPMEILLVEDNYGDVLLAQEAFRASKIANNVVVAADGQQALCMLHKEPPYQDFATPDLVLLDLNLPKRDGREVLEVVKRDPNLKRIPVVVLTGSRAQAEVSRTYALHANAYIVKPVNFERLKEIVSSIDAFWFSVVMLPGSAQGSA